MHQLAQRTVREALARGARIDCVEHFDDLAELDRAARGTARRRDSEYYDALDQPLVLGSGKGAAILWSPSYAALEWIAEKAAEWFGDRQYALAVAWALSEARRSEGLQTACTRRAARRMVLRWARGRNCSAASLCEAADELVRRGTDDAGDDSGEVADDQPADAVGRMLVRLQDELGENDRFWLFGPVARLNTAIEYLQDKDRAEARALAKAHGAAIARDPDDPDVVDFRRWRKASDAFLEKFVPTNLTEAAQQFDAFLEKFVPRDLTEAAQQFDHLPDTPCDIGGEFDV